MCIVPVGFWVILVKQHKRRSERRSFCVLDQVDFSNPLTDHVPFVTYFLLRFS